MIEFEWDQNNIKHICDDYPERGNTLFSVESIFYDPNMFIHKKAQVGNEERFHAVGKSISGLIHVVVHTAKNNRIRPVSCWPANYQTKRLYYDKCKE